MVAPTVVSRSEHTLSRRDIDPDALKVLYRLNQFDHLAYLVGGGVRDLLLGRKPKDFDIGTSAHPQQIKRLFRNCWIIGRRFRLAHVKFGQKTIEVATFRRHVTPGSERDPDPAPRTTDYPPRSTSALIHRDNTFGTPEEDAFRRDFTINALFYDIATFALIDYVGGLADLEGRLIRCIGNPNVRFREDPVRMVRALALAARLDFRIDEPITAAIRKHRAEIRHAAPPRMLEELYKILRSGYAEQTFRALARSGLLELVAPELHKRQSEQLWQSLAALDTYRQRFDTAPSSLTNPVLLGSLVVPIGTLAGLAADDSRRRGAPVAIGALPVARGDVERLRQVLGLQRRMTTPDLAPRAQRAVLHRNVFGDALTWLEIHGERPELLEHWRALARSGVEHHRAGEPDQARPKRRRRRRRPRRPRNGEG